jgi:hypothetical protein
MSTRGMRVSLVTSVNRLAKKRKRSCMRNNSNLEKGSRLIFQVLVKEQKTQNLMSKKMTIFSTY